MDRGDSMSIKQLPALARAWLKANFPRPATFKLPARMRRIRITDEAIRTACILGGFAAFCWGLWDIAPWLAKIIGGLCLVWFGWPTGRDRP